MAAFTEQAIALSACELLAPVMDSHAPAPSDTFTYEMDSTESVTEAVLTAVSAVTGESPGPVAVADDEMSAPNLTPLYTAVDPDALDALFQPSIGNALTAGIVRFSYAGCIVTVQSDGRITVQSNAGTGSSDPT